MQINSNETLAAFRSQIAMQLKDSPNPSTLRLITSGKELKNIGKTLSELGISDQQQFHVTRRIVSNDTSQMHVSETIDQGMMTGYSNGRRKDVDYDFPREK